MFRSNKIKYLSYAMFSGCGYCIYQSTSNFSFSDSLPMQLKFSLYCPPGAQFNSYNQQSSTTLGQYNINPHLHYKIWFSGDLDKFLPNKNQERLVEFRKRNPNDIMTLIYSGQMLSKMAVFKMYFFCFRWKIIPLNFDNIVTKSPIENELRSYAIEEMKYHKHGGNLAAASDIVRFLSPTQGLGVYSDFDTKIDTSLAPDKISISAPFLFRFILIKKSIFGYANFCIVNNDLLYIADFQSEEVKKIQQLMAERCRNSRLNFCEIFDKSLRPYLNDYNNSGNNANANANSISTTGIQLFAFRSEIAKSIPRNESLKRAYISSVVNLTGPGIICIWINQQSLLVSNLVRYSFLGYRQLQGAFICNEEQDHSWLPGNSLA